MYKDATFLSASGCRQNTKVWNYLVGSYDVYSVLLTICTVVAVVTAMYKYYAEFSGAIFRIRSFLINQVNFTCLIWLLFLGGTFSYCLLQYWRGKQNFNDTSKEAGLKVNAEKTKYMLLSCYQNAEQNCDKNIANRSFDNVALFKYLVKSVKNIRNWFTRKLRTDWIWVMIATIQSRNFLLSVSCIKT
jgi:hypothetical protein